MIIGFEIINEYEFGFDLSIILFLLRIRNGMTNT